ncbi:MAG: arsenosugar biosynthesis radical SAM protein ArsS [Chlorobi bacterium]|nr:MAG: Fe-S oxidoreductase [Chlorobi bacterium OLB7]MBK8911316.1 arsenosugar biosynthesis radical SAM protein ArsS [Chlorobiota bacterium]MBX7217694.1 arsenosugar biosynthesis radical SAM protein ArsS [Candidatus Kapabacteria bacterium]
MPYDFHDKIQQHSLELPPASLATLQVNVGKLCNQACLHCHVDASPKRTEAMDQRTAQRVIEVLAAHPQIATLDITGGAPELNPHFDWMVAEAKKLGKHVMVRHNLTVQFDGNPVTGESKEYLPEFFAEHRCEVVSSLPYYSQYFTDKQRGRGVFNKSIEGMRRLNDVGYAKDGSGLVLNLVYNPVGAFLPAAQAGLEADYKRELAAKFGLHFNSLFTITNMPIHRFKADLVRHGGYDSYMEKLLNAFNPAAAEGVMCRSQISVNYDGRLSDCDFNQMLELPVESAAPQTIFDWDFDALLARRIVFADHCFGCTAGAGSSCGGATA